MKTRLLCAALSLMAISASAQGLSSGIDKANLDTSVRPGDDFYEYSSGGWLKSHPLDAEHPMNGSFSDLADENELRIKELILDYASKPQVKGSLGQKIGSLYNLMMDSVRLNKDGYAPLKPTLARIDSIKNHAEYQVVMAQLARKGNGTIMVGISPEVDMRDAANNIVGVYQGGLGLGERDYYLQTDSQTVKVLNAYKAYLTKLFTLVGNDEATAKKKMNAVLAIETRIAKPTYSQVQLRDVSGNYHKMSYAQLVANFPGIDWGNTFLALGYPTFATVDVGQPEPIKEIGAVLTDTPLDDLKAYAEASVLVSAASQLDDKFRDASFEFSKAMLGVQQDRPRWKRAVGAVSGVLGEAIGKLYVEKYFPESSKKRMLELVHNLQTALSQRINEATWMGAETKAQAQDKLSNFIVKIGYPDKWKDYSTLQINDSLSLHDNLANVSEWFLQDDINKKVNKPVDKTEWGMTPQTVNAYYNPTTNEICFPAAILQPPFFDPSADDAANYGGIGVVIGHEMSHGFDDQGCQFDKSGNQHNWWTATDKKNFDARAKVLADYFSTLEALPGKKINGQQTLGENIGDNGGLHVAFRALQNDMEANPLTVKGGFTPEQRFFLAYGRVWASNMRPETEALIMTTDVHSPNKWRVNGALPMIDEWYKAFSVKKGDKLFVPAKQRARIW